MNEAAEQKTPFRFALILGVAWLLALGLILLVTLGREEPWRMGLFIGRFHILIVHIPIGLLCFAGILEIASRLKWFKDYHSAVYPTLWVGMLGALAATFVGFIYFRSEDISGNSMNWHLWTGLSVAVGSILTLILKILQKAYFYEGALAGTIVLVGLSSHYGGNMVHGSDYLAEHAPNALKPLLGGHVEEEDPASEVADVTQLVIYEHLLQPVFDAKCVECHGPEKVKGDLRMDSFEELAKGGEYGDEFIPGNSQDSELVFRVTIDPSEDEFMPPDEKEPMTAAEVRLMEWWIDAGGSATMTVAEAQPDEEMLEIVKSLVESRTKSISQTHDSEVTTPEDSQNVTSTLAQVAGSLGMRVEESDTKGTLVDASLVAAKISDAQIAKLVPYADSIARLNLGHSKVTDKGLDSIAAMTNLTWLHLGGTKVSNQGLSKLTGLTHLTYLNLYESQVTNEGLQYLAGMSDLRHLYLWQTDTPPEAQASRPSVEVAQNEPSSKNP